MVSRSCNEGDVGRAVREGTGGHGMSTMAKPCLLASVLAGAAWAGVSSEAAEAIGWTAACRGGPQ